MREVDVITLTCGKKKYMKPYWCTFISEADFSPLIGPCPGCNEYL